VLPVRSEVGEERIVVEERLRLWSIVGGRYVGFEMLRLLYGDMSLSIEYCK
jgi:hypothetical protein